jgi:hypothetical protein
MYCSTCGRAISQGLSYCNHCGVKLNKEDGLAKSSELKPELLVRSMTATFVLGLMTMTVLMAVLRVIVGLRIEPTLILMALPFLVMLILEAVFIRLLLRGSREYKMDRKVTTEHATNELDVSQVRAISEGMPSVTEHTTRTFEPIYRGSSAKDEG